MSDRRGKPNRRDLARQQAFLRAEQERQIELFRKVEPALKQAATPKTYAAADNPA